MSNVLTNQIIKQLNKLPIIKRKAILELIKTDSTIVKKHNHAFQEKWRTDLLKTSVWTDSEINEIYKAREFINKWKPQQFF